jgi:hypothetical protein
MSCPSPEVSIALSLSVKFGPVADIITDDESGPDPASEKAPGGGPVSLAISKNLKRFWSGWPSVFDSLGWTLTLLVKRK